MNESKYVIVTLCKNGYVMNERFEDTLKAAQATAKYLLSAEYARASETDIDDTDKVEVRLASSQECVYDLFRS